MVIAPTPGIDMNGLRGSIALLAALAMPAAFAESTVVIVQGLGGNPAYEEAFTAQVEALAAAMETLAPTPAVRVFRGERASRDGVLEFLSTLSTSMSERDQLHVYLIGHGSYDDEEYKFNIPGPDLTGADLLAALEAIPSGNQIVVNTSSASGAAADVWQGGDRVVITATRSGVERHATRFGQYFVEALAEPAADVDKNRIITAQEAFNFADRRVADFFEANGNLATEHARLDGDRAARFSLARLGAVRPARQDVRIAELTAARDELAARIEDLRLARDDMAADDYQARLLGLMLELAEAEEAIEAREAELDAND
jgi:hypothetical protein